MRSPRPALVALVSAVALLAGACAASGGSSSDAATTTTGRGPGPTATTTTAPRSSTAPPKASGSLAWHDCDGGFECAELDVPLDYAEPDGRTISLGIVRRPATDPDRRIGTLFVNPGGPGGSAVDLAESIPLPRELTARFDIIGVDPRGVGRSTPLDCHSHLLDIYDADPSPDDDADRTELLDASKEFVAECQDKYGDLLPHLGTADVARDMDQVRAALGEDQLSYLGYSYGTSIGQQYARLFPERVRAMVLDGIVDTQMSGLAFADEQAGGYQRTLDAYTASCAPDDCGLGAPPELAIRRLLAEADRRPIPSSSGDRPATEGMINLALGLGLRSPTFWPQLSSALRRAQQGDGDGINRLADEYLGTDTGGEGLGFEIYFAVSCLDQDWPSDPQAVLDAAARTGEKYPEIGAGIVSDYVRCALWPTPPQPLPPIPADIEGLAPIVLVSTTNDPATPYEAGVRVAKSIPGAVLITNEGDQHTVVAQGKACIDDPVVEYLVDEKVPKAGIRCR